MERIKFKSNCKNEIDSEQEIFLIFRPLAQPGFDALNMSAPFIVQMNNEGKWESKTPENLDEERLKAIVQHLVNSKAISAAQSYCCQCAAENQVKTWYPVNSNVSV